MSKKTCQHPGCLRRAVYLCKLHEAEAQALRAVEHRRWEKEGALRRKATEDAAEDAAVANELRVNAALHALVPYTFKVKAKHQADLDLGLLTCKVSNGLFVITHHYRDFSCSVNSLAYHELGHLIAASKAELSLPNLGLPIKQAEFRPCDVLAPHARQETQALFWSFVIPAAFGLGGLNTHSWGWQYLPWIGRKECAPRSITDGGCGLYGACICKLSKEEAHKAVSDLLGRDADAPFDRDEVLGELERVGALVMATAQGTIDV